MNEILNHINKIKNNKDKNANNDNQSIIRIVKYLITIMAISKSQSTETRSM
jgi:hypothetical protein